MTNNVTIDLTKNPKQADYFTKIIGASVGSYPYKYFSYGGAIRGGKTFVTLAAIITLANKFKGSKWHCVRQDLPVLQSTTIPSFEKLIRGSNNWKVNRNPSNFFFYNRYDSKIFFKGESIRGDPDLIDFLGLETNGIFLEQAEELSEKMWDMAIQRSGSWYIEPMPPAFIFLTFNPSQTWVKNKFYLPWVKGLLKPPFYFESALPKDNPFVTADQWDSWSRMAERYQKQFIEGNWSDYSDVNGRWAFAFDRKKHVGKCSINFKHPVFLSFDFNRNPICCGIIQHYNDTIYIPYCIKLANSNIYSLCDFILSGIPGMNKAVIIVTGDATGSHSSALVKDNLNYYTVIKQKLNLSDQQFKVPQVNPRLEDNQVLINSLLSNYKWVIDETNANWVIYDMENVRMLADGSIDKGNRNDPTKQADAIDLTRYWCNVEMSWFLKFKTEEMSLDESIFTGQGTILTSPPGSFQSGDGIDYLAREKNNMHAISEIYKGGHVQCTVEEYYQSVRDAILQKAGQWIDTRDEVRAQLALMEVKRLDEMFSTQKSKV